LVLKRELDGFETFVAVINLRSEKTVVDLKDVFEVSRRKKFAATSSGSLYRIG
jgi:hypothetical protein